MKNKSRQILLSFLACLLFGATAKAASFTSIADGDWTAPATWNCTASCAGEDGIPDADDTVTIPNPRVVTVSGAQSVHILTVNVGGTLTLNAGSTLTLDGTPGSNLNHDGIANGTGALRTQGTTTIAISGTFTAPLEIIGGTTSIPGASGGVTTGGSVRVFGGATFSTSNQTAVAGGNLTVDAGGSITKSSGSFNINGANVVNNGTISGSTYNFNGGASQNLSGTGVFTGDYNVLNGTTVNLTGNVSFGNGLTATSFAVNAGGTLNVGANTLTFNQINISGAGIYTGTTGKISVQNVSTIAGATNLNSALEISSGTTTIGVGSAVIGGSLTVLSGATFSHTNQSLTHTGDLIVNAGGTVSNTSGTYNFSGVVLTNNGTINALGQFDFERAGTQNFSGAGTFVGDIVISNGSTVNITSSVTIGDGATASTLTVNSGGTLAVGANTLTLNGVALSGAGAFTSAAGGKLRTQATSSISVGAAFTGAVEINSGTTTGVGSIGGSLTILSGATYNTTNQTVTIGGDLTVNAGGTMTKTSGTVSANGANVTNNGTITGGSFNFNGGAAQTFSGAGILTAAVSVLNGTTVTLTSDVTIGNGTVGTTLAVNSGGTLAVGNNTLTLNAVAVSGAGAYTSGAGGKLRTQGTSSVNVGAAFTGSLEINSGTTNAVSSTFGGPVTILSGATLNITNQTITTNGDLNVGGSLISSSSNGTFNANGANIVNNGTISGISFRFGGTAQSLSGTGSISSAATILSGSTVTLGSNHQLSTLAVNSGGTLNTAAFTLFLNGAGTPLSGGGTITNVNVTYNGSAPQTVQSSASYNRLGIDNAAGVTLSSAETVTERLIMANGTFNNGAFLTVASGATIERSSGTLQNAPALGGTVNVEYTGAGNVTTGVEFPNTVSAVANLTINKAAPTNTVTLDGNRTVNGALALTSGRLLTTGSFAIFIASSGTSTGSNAGFVVGSIQKTFAAPAPFTFHVGTTSGYSPATINVDAGAGTFTVGAANGVIGGLDPALTLNRFWSLTQSGITQADITFQYQDTDVPVTAVENQFRFVRNNGGVSNTFFTPSSKDATANIFTLNNVTQFSDWTLHDSGPTAASVAVAGRVMAGGIGVPRTTVSITDQNGNVRKAITNAFGYYQFDAVQVGQTYTLNALSKQHQFQPRIVTVTEDMTDLNFTAQP